MNLVIDQGNTFTKFGVFDKKQLIYFNSNNILDEKIIAYLINQYAVSQIIISSVQQHFTSIEEVKALLKLPQNTLVIILSSDTLIPITNQYKTPHTLGRDRIAALVGASLLFHESPKLVIDAGTAITIDYLNAENSFEGGNISPGLQTRFNSLHQNTKKLPLLHPNEKSPFMGQNTNEAIWSGVQNGVLLEIDSYIDHFLQLNEKTKAILTGGDADFFANNLKNPIFVHQNLVLTGLNAILEYNVQTK